MPKEAPRIIELHRKKAAQQIDRDHIALVRPGLDIAEVELKEQVDDKDIPLEQRIKASTKLSQRGSLIPIFKSHLMLAINSLETTDKLIAEENKTAEETLKAFAKQQKQVEIALEQISTQVKNYEASVESQKSVQRLLDELKLQADNDPQIRLARLNLEYQRGLITDQEFEQRLVLETVPVKPPPHRNTKTFAQINYQ